MRPHNAIYKHKQQSSEQQQARRSHKHALALRLPNRGNTAKAHVLRRKTVGAEASGEWH
jgi:hypothetical protein